MNLPTRLATLAATLALAALPLAAAAQQPPLKVGLRQTRARE